MIRVAAIADTHCSEYTRGVFRHAWAEINDSADVFLLGGDLTNVGKPSEAEILADELGLIKIPIIAVMGNHDYHSSEHEAVRVILEQAGVRVLEGSSHCLKVGNETLGVAGIKGFGGGFAGACGTAFGEPEMKQYVGHSIELAQKLRHSLRTLTADYRVVLMHYSPVDLTLRGEPLPIYPFMGSYLFAEVCDELGADLIIHGHSHHGSEQGVTAGGIPVRNVAMPLVRHPYLMFHLSHSESYLPFGAHAESPDAR